MLLTILVYALAGAGLLALLALVVRPILVDRPLRSDPGTDIFDGTATGFGSVGGLSRRERLARDRAADDLALDAEAHGLFGSHDVIEWPWRQAHPYVPANDDDIPF